MTSVIVITDRFSHDPVPNHRRASLHGLYDDRHLSSVVRISSLSCMSFSTATLRGAQP